MEIQVVLPVTIGARVEVTRPTEGPHSVRYGDLVGEVGTVRGINLTRALVTSNAGGFLSLDLNDCDFIVAFERLHDMANPLVSGFNLKIL